MNKHWPERIQALSPNLAYFCPAGGAIEPKYLSLWAVHWCTVTSHHTFTCACERERHTCVCASSSDSPELIVKPLKASVPVLLVWSLDLETLFQWPFNLPVTVQSRSLFVLPCSLPLFHQSCLNSSFNTFVRFFFFSLFLSGVLCSRLPRRLLCCGWLCGDRL